MSASSYRWVVLSVVSSALFLVVVDATILYTALPRLTHDLAAGALEKLWILNSYSLVMAAFLPGMGTLGDRIGHKRLFLGGLVLFGLASVASAYAPSAYFLIGARVFLGVAAAMMMPTTLSIIRLTFVPPRERAFAIGIWSAIAAGGAALGPLVGGALLNHFWWGSVFLINVPIVVAALFFAVFLIPEYRNPNPAPWDLTASILIGLAFLGLVYGIKECGVLSPAMPVIVAAMGLGGVFMYFFIRRLKKSECPLVDFGLFRNPAFSIGAAGALLVTMAQVGMVLLISQRFQLVDYFTPFQTGLVMLPMAVASLVSSPLAGLMMSRWGGVRMIWASFFISGAGITIFLAATGWLSAQLAAMAVFGFGAGVIMACGSALVMQSAPPERAGMAASIEEVSYELGAIMGVAFLGSLMNGIYSSSMKFAASIPAEAGQSLDLALLAAESMNPEAAARLTGEATGAFVGAFNIAMTADIAILVLTGMVILTVSRR